MKANEKQKLLIDNIVSLTNYWKDTNDISSPSHTTLIEEECNASADDLNIDYDDERILKLNDALLDLLNVIRKFDD